MSLLALPDELLSQIAKTVSQTVPNDVEDFGRACRRLRNVATPLIREHRKSLKVYTDLRATNAVAADIIFEICKRPWIAVYPRSLELLANRNQRTLLRPRTPKQASIIDAFKLRRDETSDDELREVINGSGCVPVADVNTWIDSIRRGDEDYLFATLLTCLPKVERLVVRLDLEKMEQTKEMIRTIKREWHRRPALPNLRDVRVREKDGARTCDLEIFPLLATIPGLQKVHAFNLTGRYLDCYRDGWLLYPGASESITHVNLETCGMTVEGLETFMQSLCNLKEFRYIAHRTGWGVHGANVFLKNARKTLQTLVISTGGGSSRYIGSLREFTALKHVTLDTDMLIRNGRMQRFVDVMPASIETCTIAGNNMTTPMQNKFLADLFRPSFFYPCLRRILVEDSWGSRNIGQDRLRFQREFHKQTNWMTQYK